MLSELRYDIGNGVVASSLLDIEYPTCFVLDLLNLSSINNLLQEYVESIMRPHPLHIERMRAAYPLFEQYGEAKPLCPLLLTLSL